MRDQPKSEQKIKLRKPFKSSQTIKDKHSRLNLRKSFEFQYYSRPNRSFILAPPVRNSLGFPIKPNVHTFSKSYHLRKNACLKPHKICPDLHRIAQKCKKLQLFTQNVTFSIYPYITYTYSTTSHQSRKFASL